MKYLKFRSSAFASARAFSLTVSKSKVIVLLVVVSSLINVGMITVPDSILATALSFSSLFILPGFLLAEIVLKERGLAWLELLPISFVLGLTLLSLPAVLSVMLHINLDVLGWAATMLNLALASLYLCQAASLAMANRDTANIPANRPNLSLLAATTLAMIGVVFLYLVTASTWSFGDNWSYLLYIRQYLDQPLTSLTDHLAGVSSGSGRTGFGAWVILQAVMDKVAKSEPVDIYSFYLPPLLLILSLLALYSLANLLFQSQNAALLAVLVQVLYSLSSIGSHDWMGRGFFDRVIEDKFLIWLIILPVTTLLMLTYLTTGYKKHLLPVALSTGALSLIHPLGLVQWGISLAAFAPVYLIFKPTRSSLSRLIFIFMPLLLFLLVPLLQRQLVVAPQETQQVAFDYTGGSDIQFLLSQTRLWVFSAVENQYIAHPQLVAHPLIIVAILLTPLLIRYLPHSIAAQFLFSNMALPLLLLYNPITAPLLGRLITPWMLWRISWLLPVALTITFFLDKIGNRIQKLLLKYSGVPWRPGWLPVTPLLLVVLLALPLHRYMADGVSLLKERKVRTMTAQEQDLLLFLREYIASGEVVMAEPELNTYIPAFSSAAQVLTFRFTGIASAREDIDRFYRTSLVTGSTMDLLERWNIRYVVIEPEHNLAFQFQRLPLHFTRRYQNGAYELYEVLPDPPPDHILVGNTHFLQGAWDEALTEYQAALRLNPNETLAAFGLGQVYQSQGQRANAQLAYQQLLELDPDYMPGHLALAQLYASEGRIGEAINQYQIAIARRPDYRPLFEALGDLYLAQGEPDKAFAQYRQAVNFPAGTADHYLALGNLAQGKGLSTQASAAYQEVINQKPMPDTAANAYLELGKIYQRTSQWDKAKLAYQHALMLTGNQHTYTQLGNFYLAQGQLDQTLALYQTAMRRNLNAAWPHLELGKVYLRQLDK